MLTVYALFNSINQEIYIGITIDLSRRLFEHNSGKSKYTKAYKPWTVFYSEICENYTEARKREIFFKSTNGRRELRKKLTEYNLPDSEI
jgi:putative endonuclease